MTVRLAVPEDAGAMLEIYGPIVRETAISFETEVPGLKDFRGRIEKYHLHAPWLACEAEGRLAGYAYATRYRERLAYQWSAECTVYVHDELRGQGVGALLYRNLLHALRMQGYCNAYAAITLPNPASVRLHEAQGFRSIGVYEGVGYKLGGWHDVGWWGLRLQEQPARPEPPRPPGEALTAMEWEAS
ncbi:MAG: GNAT family N-acetyltransferase [SAR324 cluster bacterium]|nr:GNAT family N-acetyltransferase [SAR324 cluster bacterium]